MKKVKDSSKRSNATGDINRNRIYQLILRHSMNNEWVSQKTILDDLERPKGKALFRGKGMIYKKRLKERALSKQAVIQHLKVLVEEDWIEKRRLKYFVKRFLDDDGLSIYGKFFETFGSGPKFLKNPPGEPELGPHWGTEEFISEFSRRIGRYISYVFTEALRQQRTHKSIQMRSKIASHFIHQSVPLDSFLAIFRDIMPKEKEDRSSNRWEVGPNTYKKITYAYHNLYPKTWEYIEKELSEFIDMIVGWFSPAELGNNCDHKWHGMYIAKKGEYQTCMKCPAIVKYLD